jgi:hypothetical protein
MNEKPVKVDIDFNEALRRIAKTPKGLVVPPDNQKEIVEGRQDKDVPNEKAALSKKKSAAKVKN